MIEKDEILHLGTLARIRLTEAEVAALQTDMNAVLDYVSVVNEIAGSADETKQVGSRCNVFRKDELTNTPGEYTDALLNEMPATEGRYLKVKKILNAD